MHSSSSRSSSKSSSTGAHRQVLEADVSQRLRLWLVHAVRQLREDAVHVLEERAKQHLLPPRLEQRQLRVVGTGAGGKGWRSGAGPAGCTQPQWRSGNTASSVSSEPHCPGPVLQSSRSPPQPEHSLTSTTNSSLMRRAISRTHSVVLRLHPLQRPSAHSTMLNHLAAPARSGQDGNNSQSVRSGGRFAAAAAT